MTTSKMQQLLLIFIKQLRKYARSDWPKGVFAWEYINMVVTSRCFAFRALTTQARNWKSFWVKKSTSLLQLIFNVYHWNLFSADVCQPYWREIGELKQRQWRRQRERQKKKKRFRLTKQQLCKCITLFCTFLCLHGTTTTWKYLISRLVEDLKTRHRLYFSFPELLYSLL